MNKSTSPNRPRNPLIVALYLAPTVILLLAIAMLWRNHTEATDRVQQLTVQNSKLQQELTTAKAEINDLNSGDSSKETRERLSTMRTNRTSLPVNPVKEEVETLFLQEATVQQTSAGLAVHLEFNVGEGLNLPEDITLVVRVPGNSSSKIVSLHPASAANEASAEGIVNATGSLGIIQCSPSELNTLAFALTVTEPVKATIRGSEGIIDFEIDIAPDGCTVRKL